MAVCFSNVSRKWAWNKAFPFLKSCMAILVVFVGFSDVLEICFSQCFLKCI